MVHKANYFSPFIIKLFHDDEIWSSCASLLNAFYKRVEKIFLASRGFPIFDEEFYLVFLWRNFCLYLFSWTLLRVGNENWGNFHFSNECRQLREWKIWHILSFSSFTAGNYEAIIFHFHPFYRASQWRWWC